MPTSSPEPSSDVAAQPERSAAAPGLQPVSSLGVGLALPPQGVGLTATHVLALQRTAGNRAVSSMLQRTPIDAARALEIAAMMAIDPQRAAALLTEIAWDQLPDAVRLRVIDSVLSACELAVRRSRPPMTQLTVPWLAVQHAGIGFLVRVRTGFSTDQKVAVVTRFIGLWASPTSNFAQGFLAGFAVGLWDGVSGPFVLLWDLLQLEAKLHQLQLQLLTSLAQEDTRREIIAALDATYQRVAPMVGRALSQLLDGQADAQVLLQALGELLVTALQASERAGGAMADALMEYFMSASDQDLGHALGRIEGNLVFEVVLLALTEGGYTVVKNALAGSRWLAEALQNLNRMRAALRGLEAAELLATSLARFSAAIRRSRVLSEIADALGEVWQLILRFIRASYGLDGPGARAGRISPLAESVDDGVRIMRELRGGGRIKLLENGRIAICHSPCMYIEQRFERELAGPGGDAFRRRLEDVAERERQAIAAGDRAAEEALFAEADRINTELENLRLGALRRRSGLDDATLREFLLEANDRTDRVEQLLDLSGNDAGRVRGVLRYCARDEMALEHMLEGARLFRTAPVPPGPVMVDARLRRFHPSGEANVPHFLDEHTYAHFDVNQIGNSPNKTFWPEGTTRADVERRLLEALEKLRIERRLPADGRWQRVVNLDGDLLVRVGSNPLRIGQFHPIGGPGTKTFGNEELRVLARLFGR